MRVLIIGAGGFLGDLLSQKLIEQPKLPLAGHPSKDISELVLADLYFPQGRSDSAIVTYSQGDIAQPSYLDTLFAQPFDVIFHLAAVVSGEAEKDFELGRRVNLLATESILEHCRRLGNSPVFVFASSCAVFGGDFGGVVTDHTRTTPQSSYGTQKALGELLVNDYSRRQFVDGRSLRLPTICVRPGKANAATTSFVSGIIREPLSGRTQNCPVSPTTKVWMLSPERVISNIRHAAAIDAESLGDHRLINLPGITVTISEMVASLRKVKGDQVANLITWNADAFLQGIVLTFPHTFNTPRATDLGFKSNENFEEILQEYISNHMETS